MTGRYVIASVATGEIVRAVRCAPSQALAQVLEGERLFESDDATATTHRLVGDSLVPYTVAQARAKTARPEWPSKWDNAAMAWIDQRTTAEARAERAEKLKAAIAELEATQARPQREALLAIAAGRPIPAATAARLASIESGVAALLASLNAN